MRTPSAALVVDASIILAALIGASYPVFEKAALQRRLVTSARALEEVTRRIELGLKQPALLAKLPEMLAFIEVWPTTRLGQLSVIEAAISLKSAVASRNGSVNDAHLLALAWQAEADIWSTDRDFAGTGMASWSTSNLMDALRRS